METVCATAEAYSTVVPAEIVLVTNAGHVVAAALPSLNVLELLRLSVPVEVIWEPPSLKMLLDVTSPIVRVVTVEAAPRVTPVELFTLRVVYVPATAVWAPEPLYSTVPPQVLLAGIGVALVLVSTAV